MRQRQRVIRIQKAKGRRLKKLRARDKHYQKKYGITLQLYDKLLQLQNYRCMVCETMHEESYRKRLSVDHCHATGQVRGLLCRNCNLALGFARDNPDILKRLAIYVEFDLKRLRK